jgi:hypothetical protein
VVALGVQGFPCGGDQFGCCISEISVVALLVPSFCSFLRIRIFSFAMSYFLLEEFMCGTDYAHFYLYRPPIVLLNLDNQCINVNDVSTIKCCFKTDASGKRYVLCFNMCGVMI